MKTYEVPVRYIEIRGKSWNMHKIHFIIVDRKVDIKEFPDIHFRCSKMMFRDLKDSHGYTGDVMVQSDGLKAVFNKSDRRIFANVALLRSHIDEICGISTEQSKKKRPASDSKRSPAAEMRYASGASRTYNMASGSPYVNKYQRNMASSATKNRCQIDSIMSSRSAADGAVIGTRSRSNSEGTSEERELDLNSGCSQHDAEELVSSIISPTKTPQISSGKKRKNESPHKKILGPNDKRWEKLFSRSGNSARASSTVSLAPSHLPMYSSTLSLTPSNHRTTSFSKSQDKEAYSTPPRDNLAETSYSASPLEQSSFRSERDSKDKTSAIRNLFGNSTPLNLGGIKNQGNTCFIGAVLQALFCLERFNSDLLSPLWSSVLRKSSFFEGGGDKSSSTEEYVRFIRSHESRQNSLNIRKFKDFITAAIGKYKGYLQHDAHEFLCDFLNLVEEELDKGLDSLLSEHGVMLANEVIEESSDRVKLSDCLSTASSVFSTPTTSTASVMTVTAKNKCEYEPCRDKGVETSVFRQICFRKVLNPSSYRFCSVVESTLTCTTCGKDREIHEHYKDFALEMSMSNSNHSSISIYELLNTFFGKETRDLHCEHCDTKNAKVEVKNFINKLPDCLCLHLKRFQFDPLLQKFDKISSKVLFPSILNMKGYCSFQDTGDSFDMPNRTGILQEDYTALLSGPYVQKKKFDVSNGTESSKCDEHSSDAASVAFSDDEMSKENLYWTCDSCTYAQNRFSSATEIEVCELCNEPRCNIHCNDNMDSMDEDDALDIDESTIPFTYELVAVLRHVGPNATTGHYTCDIKRNRECQKGVTEKVWQHCDDSVLTPINQKSVLMGQEDPYILFYQKC